MCCPFVWVEMVEMVVVGGCGELFSEAMAWRSFMEEGGIKREGGRNERGREGEGKVRKGRKISTATNVHPTTLTSNTHTHTDTQVESVLGIIYIYIYTNT